uniref:uncharacterized protein LOC120338354 n=1 Tax=Styela clava TaxID=7725 RepID=UPI0019399A84|nr:uncharacterized protein LOC120338354 [Styela clava]
MTDWMKICALLLALVGISISKESPDGVCVRKLIKGKLVSVGSCENNNGQGVIDEVRARLEATKRRERERLEDSKRPVRENCGVLYNSKCFIYIPSVTKYDAAKALCTNIGGQLANIYNQIHYKLIEDYLRTKTTYVLYAWTGLIYRNEKLYLSTGQEVTFPLEYWYGKTKNQGSDPNVTRTHLYVSEDPNSSTRGINVPPPTAQAYGPLCET